MKRVICGVTWNTSNVFDWVDNLTGAHQKELEGAVMQSLATYQVSERIGKRKLIPTRETFEYFEEHNRSEPGDREP